MKILTLILLTVTLFTSNGLTYVIQNHEIINAAEEIPGRSLQSSALFGPIIVTCIIAFDVIILLGGALVTKLALMLSYDRNAKVISYENNHINERTSTNSISTAAYVSSFYAQNLDEFQGFNNNVKIGEYYDEIYDDYFREDDDDNEFSTKTKPPRSTIQMPNSSIPHINSNETTIINVTQNITQTISRENPPSPIQFQFPSSTASAERKKIYSFI